jgi:hypothetical protein
MKRFFPITQTGTRTSCFIVQADQDLEEELRSMGANCISFDDSLSRILSEPLAGEATVFRGWSGMILGTQEALERLQQRLESQQWERKLRN